MIEAESQKSPSENHPNHADRSVLLDLVHLTRQTLGDSKLEAEVLGMFRHMMGTYHERLSKSLNPEEIALNLHSLKGAAAGVGAFAVAAAARVAEGELSSDGKLSRAALNDLENAISLTAAYIDRTFAP